MQSPVLALREAKSSLHAALLTAVESTIGTAPLRKSRCSLEMLQRARWQLAVTSELAQPGLMELVPIHDSRRQVIDFEWTGATRMASHLLTGLEDDLAGRRLLDVMANHADILTVFDAYRNVAAHCMASVVVVQRSGAGMVSAAVHRVHASPEGIAVVLYSPSAVSREAACERALRALEAEVAQQR